MADSKIWDVAVIGAGCAGLAAGMYAGRFGLKTVVIGELPGGTITQTHLVENYPGFTSLTGLELGNKLLEHAKSYGVPIQMESVESAKKRGDGLFEIKSDSAIYISKTIIFATGADWKKLGMPSEKKFTNVGVHYCALCDGAFYKKKRIAVIGSGDSAIKESLLLADFGSKVVILIRGDKMKGEPINNKRVSEHPKIEVFYNVEVKEFLGGAKLEKLKLTKKIKLKGGKESDEILMDAAFVLIGNVPRSELAKTMSVKLDGKGQIIIDKMARTNVEGIYSAGDVTDGEFKQAIVSASEGVCAAYSAHLFLSKKEK